MTWQELKEEAKKMGYVECAKFPYDKKVIALVNEDLEIAFYRDGVVECNAYNDDCCGRPFTYNRTIKQMLAIMKALQIGGGE